MNIQERISAFNKLGNWLKQLNSEELSYLGNTAKAHNGWFIPENVELALKGVQKWLDSETLGLWLDRYALPEENTKPQTVGVVMAGNIPLVGFHDFLSVLISGNKVQAKLSSQDPVLLKVVVEKLIEIEPRFSNYIDFVERLHNMDAVIATGSNNTSRYFDYYFGKYPHIIRKNRTSCAILSGEEDKDDLVNLGKDIFYYFGLGCRNISKLFVPQNYDFSALIEGLDDYKHVMDNHKYANNYHYNRSIFLVNCVPHLDAGFCLFQKNESLSSPTSVIYFQEYALPDQLAEMISEKLDQIQCIVSKDGRFRNSLKFGQAQEPELWDYADGIDTMRFLKGLGGLEV
jgi:hypothetical protein